MRTNPECITGYLPFIPQRDHSSVDLILLPNEVFTYHCSPVDAALHQLLLELRHAGGGVGGDTPWQQVRGPLPASLRAGGALGAAIHLLLRSRRA